MQALVGSPGCRQAGAASRLCFSSPDRGPRTRPTAGRGDGLFAYQRGLGDRDGTPPAPGVCGHGVQISQSAHGSWVAGGKVPLDLSKTDKGKLS